MSVKRLFFIIAATLAVLLPVRFYVVEPVYIASASMEPSLKKGVYLFSDKIVYKTRSPVHLEVVCFKSPVGESHDSVKRIIASAGDTIEIKAKKVYLNGGSLYEPYVVYSRPDEILSGDNMPPMQVPAGYVFVLGDNRDQFRDSALWRDEAGEHIYFLPVSSITGKIRGMYRKY